MTLTDAQRSALKAFCDAIVPAVDHPDDHDGFFARRASDVGTDEALAGVLAGLPDPGRAGLLQLLDAFAGAGLVGAEDAEGMIRAFAGSAPEVAQGVAALTGLTLYLYYGMPDPQTGVNPNWSRLGYPGPPQVGRPAGERMLAPVALTGEVSADAVVVGSGAGGSVVAAELAARGLDVVVLEAGDYLTEADFLGLEIPAHQTLYWRGGPQPTADGNISLQAGAALGGGTVINWTNCLRTPAWVREEWAAAGLDDVRGNGLDPHLDAVLTRIGAIETVSDHGDHAQRMVDGAEKLGWHWHKVLRNADPATYSAEAAGAMGFGDPSGSKLSADKTFLVDAERAGARIVIRCRARRILVENGRAAGVEAVADGQPLTVRAPIVVAAAGALESPALLRRSGIGGPAVGRFLRLHPCIAVFGAYPEPQRAWWGPPHAAVVDEFERAQDEHGFRIEGVQYTTAIAGAAVPWTTGAEHKDVMSRFAHGVSWIARVRDRGHGGVGIDEAGEALATYAITDELDLANLRRGVQALARLHEAAGAEEIVSLAEGMPRWERGADLDAYIAQAQAVPFAAGGHRMFSAHQMGTCRLGADPASSVADPDGQLHDTPGVWVADASGFPTASGVNPMVSTMALAHRTAGRIGASVGAVSAGSGA